MTYIEDNPIISNNICPWIISDNLIWRYVDCQFDLFIPVFKFLLRIRIFDPKISKCVFCNYSHKRYIKIKIPKLVNNVQYW